MNLLAELKRIEASLTPGEWRAVNPDDSAYMNMYCVVAGDADEPDDERDLLNVVCVTLLQSGVAISIQDKRWDANAAGIAALRNLLPQIIAALSATADAKTRFRERLSDALAGALWSPHSAEQIIDEVVELAGECFAATAVKALVWVYSTNKKWAESWYALTPFCTYIIRRDGGCFKWSVCFGEMHHEHDADSLEAAQSAADAHWRERIGGAIQ